MTRTLYKADVSPPARAAMMVVELVKVPGITLQDVDLLGFGHMKEDFLKLNPQHTIPTLVDGDFAVWDSHAIAAYLVDSYATDDSLYPKDLKKRATVDQRLHFDTGILFPAFGLSIRAVAWSGATALNPEGLERVEKAFEFLETFLTGQSWVAGDSMTIADICCVATVSSINEFAPIDPKKYPNIKRWLDQFSKLDFYIKRNKPGCTALGNFIRSKLV